PAVPSRASVEVVMRSGRVVDLVDAPHLPSVRSRLPRPVPIPPEDQLVMLPRRIPLHLVGGHPQPSLPFPHQGRHQAASHSMMTPKSRAVTASVSSPSSPSLAIRTHNPALAPAVPEGVTYPVR